MIVVGGGPSAQRFYRWISQRRAVSRETVLACSSMLRPLLAAGIDPDVTVVLDGHPIMPLHFVGAATRGMLVYGEGVDPTIIERWRGRKRVLGRPPAGSSVLIVAVDEALQQGATMVHLVGADFCYPANQSHAPGVVTAYPLEGRETTEEQNGKGEVVLTDRHLTLYRAELEQLITRWPRVRFYRHGREGLPVVGAEWFSGADLSG